MQDQIIRFLQECTSLPKYSSKVIHKDYKHLQNSSICSVAIADNLITVAQRLQVL